MVQRMHRSICRRLVAIGAIIGFVLLRCLRLFAYDIDIGVVASADDCKETNLGGINTTSTGLTMVLLNWGIGIRFQNVAIPQGATIDDANLQMTYGYNCGLNGCNTTLYGVDADDTSAWASGNKPSSQTQTTASVSINLSGTFAPDMSYATMNKDITAIVQEIVDRGSWVSGNNMSFVVEKDSFTRGSSYGITAYDHASYPEAQLQINYTSAGGDRRVFTSH